uniref:Uncharacterized protein n=1 Tax=Anguilla anguilla TaxID=7936 RepID=A0A0E9SJE8_ANGAN
MFSFWLLELFLAISYVQLIANYLFSALVFVLCFLVCSVAL